MLFFFAFFQKSSSFCRENEIFENKNQKQTKKLDQFLTYKKGNLGPVFNFTAYIYIYICRTAGCGTTFFQKTGWFAVHLRAGSGPTCVSHYKNRHFRGTVWWPRESPKSHKLHTPCGKSSVLSKRKAEFLHGLFQRDPVRQGVALIKIGFFEVTLCQGSCRCTNLKIFVCIKIAFCIYFANFVFLSSGMPVFVV